MSLTVPPELVRKASEGSVSNPEFVHCVRNSLPYAYDLIAGLVEERTAEGGTFADNQVEPPDEASRGQLLRAMSSNAIRGALEEHFGVTLAFQNCHRVAVFGPDAEGTAQYREFVSVPSQILNQKPELVNC
ncbi:MAG TPA: SCO5389 family protein [Mycobacteriales bacterium]|nr:SCO5389 family protein [Mycobacteriales bacterium]